MIVLRSLAFNIVDPEMNFDQQTTETVKKAWYESGAYVIRPNTIWYMIWDVVKSVLYMISLYTLAYAAAFKFQGPNDYEDFEFVVDLVQILDIIHVFFIAKKVNEFSSFVQKWRFKQL